jgi:CheY-like chemotaxis protein
MNGNLSPVGASSPHVQPSDAAASNGSRLTIILADNDPATRRTLAESLSRFHCLVLEYSTGVEALEAAACEEPDALVLSTRLPDTDGLSAIADLRSTSETTTLPVVALAPAAAIEEREEYLAAGVAGFFAKPASGTEVHWAILRALQGNLQQTASPATEPEADLPEAASF